jgi:uroporphyrinogen decarboxylase
MGMFNFMSPLQNDLLLRTLRREPTERTAVWMMRQAGRYLPDYIKLKEKYSFFERCQTPELAAAITIQPVEQIGVDAAILFSDILVVPQAMGMEVQMVEGTGPILPVPIRNQADLNRLQGAEVRERLCYVYEAIRLTKKMLNGRVPLIGFAGAPWTLLCYMVQGRGSKTFDEAKTFCYCYPELARRLLESITIATIAYLEGQVEAGVDVLQIFDSWGGLLGKHDFEQWSLPYIQQIISTLKGKVLTIIFAKGAWQSLGSLAATGADGLGIDWCVEPKTARQLAGDGITLQGNFDPAKLLSPIETMSQEVKMMMKQFANGSHIANLGHGILPNTPVNHARAFVEMVKRYQGA